MNENSEFLEVKQASKGALFLFLYLFILGLVISSLATSSLNPKTVILYLQSKVTFIVTYQIEKISELITSYNLSDTLGSLIFLVSLSAILSALIFELIWNSFKTSSLSESWEISSLSRLLTSKEKTTNVDRCMIVYWLLSLDAIVVGILGLLGPFFLYGIISNGINITTLSDLNLHPVLLFAAFVILNDFTGYWTHRWSHNLKPFWELHKFHHSATEMNMVTALRNHPLEIAMLMPFKAIVFSIVGGDLPQYLIYTWLNLFLIMFHHSNFDWRWGFLDRIFVTPQFHRLHHSSKAVHFDQNFAVLISFWDTIFGTRYTGSDNEVKYGVTRNHYNKKSLLSDLFRPIKLFFLSLFLNKWKA